MLLMLEKIIFPPTCVQTGEPTIEIDLAKKRLEKLKIARGGCPVCARETISYRICGKCLVTPPIISKTQVGYWLNDELKTMIHQYKYADNLFYSRLFSELLSFDIANIDVLVPVPLHLKRLSERGFNQSLELAKFIGKKYNLPVIEAVSRIKHTPQQIKLTKKERKINLKNAFSINEGSLNKITSIAIIDDVITTGTTVNEIAKCLNKVYPDLTIQAWAIAKTPKIR